MKQAILTRLETDDEGTRGRIDVLHELTGEVVYSCVTQELPWRQNKNDRSCAPAGSYLFKGRTDSPKHPGFVYEEWDDPKTAQREDVVGRENVQIHAANLAVEDPLATETARRLATATRRACLGPAPR